ncbi:hypothetical protein SAMD00024442_9_26 [Candidatus Symbiothrix dinenymphae]|nr:hypothetical protein SAMD00024442_9_26 [Candidatus Symbiothrix dinenymphae]
MTMTAGMMSCMHLAELEMVKSPRLKISWAADIDPQILPSTYSVAMDNKEPATYKRTVDVVPLYIPPDEIDVPVLIYNVAEGIELNSTVVTATTDNVGYFFACRQRVNADEDSIYPVTMEQHVRKLTIILNPDFIPFSIRKIHKATLSGVATKLDLKSGVHSDKKEIKLNFDFSSTDTWWTATVCLLGIVTEGKPDTILTIEYEKEGDTVTYTESIKISDDMKNFNLDKTEPKQIYGKYVEVIEAS